MNETAQDSISRVKNRLTGHCIKTDPNASRTPREALPHGR